MKARKLSYISSVGFESCRFCKQTSNWQQTIWLTCWNSLGLFGEQRQVFTDETMTEEEEGCCVHVWIEDQPCHDVTQCLMHLPDYLQTRGALQNLQRHNHESQAGNMGAMICYLYSEIMGKARAIPPSSHATIKSPALYINSIPSP